MVALGCLTSQQHASISQEQICSDSCMCCHSDVEVADQTCYLIQSQCTDTQQPVPVLTLYNQAPSRVTTGAPIVQSLVRLVLENPYGKSGNQTEACCSGGRCLNHSANEVVRGGEQVGKYCGSLFYHYGVTAIVVTQFTAKCLRHAPQVSVPVNLSSDGESLKQI